MANQVKDWRQLAQEASTENDSKKLMSLIHELNEALARERHNRREAMSPKVVLQDKEVTANAMTNYRERVRARPGNIGDKCRTDPSAE